MKEIVEKKSVETSKTAAEQPLLTIPEGMTMDPASDPQLLAIMRRTNPRYGIPPSRLETWIRWFHGRVGSAGVIALFVLLSICVIWISTVLHLGHLGGGDQHGERALVGIERHGPKPFTAPPRGRRRDGSHGARNHGAGDGA